MEQKGAYLDVNIISAADLKRAWLSGEETAALAWVDSSEKKWTSIVSGGSNVQWPHEKLSLSFNGDDRPLQEKLLTIEVYARGIFGTSLLGSVYVPLIELASDVDSRGNTILMYQIVPPSGNQDGGSMKFTAKVMQVACDYTSPSNSSVVAHPVSPTSPLEDEPDGFRFNALYPSLSGTFEANDEKPTSEAILPDPYPAPQSNFSQNYVPGSHESWQHDRLPDSSYGLVSSPQYVYPPVNAEYPPSHTAYAPCCNHANYTHNMPYPPPSSPALDTPYPPPNFIYPPVSIPPDSAARPPASVYYPPPAFSGLSYPPMFSHGQFPQTVPQHPSGMQSCGSFYPYSNFSRSLYPPCYTH